MSDPRAKFYLEWWAKRTDLEQVGLGVMFASILTIILTAGVVAYKEYLHYKNNVYYVEYLKMGGTEEGLLRLKERD